MLTNEERNQLGLSLTECAMVYGADFPKEKAIMYIDVLEKWAPNTLENYLIAISKHLNDDKNKFFPTPIQIRNYIQQKLSAEGVANEVISRITKSINRFGYSNAVDAKEYIGELGWEVVNRFGGWTYVCAQYGVALNPGSFYSQARELVKSIAESASLGKYDQPIGIPEGPKKEQIASIQKLITVKGMPLK